jgi:hypothetical protein
MGGARPVCCVVLREVHPALKMCRKPPASDVARHSQGPKRRRLANTQNHNVLMGVSCRPRLSEQRGQAMGGRSSVG